MNNFKAIKIVREYGNPPRTIRRAIVKMRRRGVSYKSAVRAVGIVNSAHAGQAYDLAHGACLCVETAVRQGVAIRCCG